MKIYNHPAREFSRSLRLHISHILDQLQFVQKCGTILRVGDWENFTIYGFHSLLLCIVHLAGYNMLNVVANLKFYSGVGGGRGVGHFTMCGEFLRSSRCMVRFCCCIMQGYSFFTPTFCCLRVGENASEPTSPWEPTRSFHGRVCTRHCGCWATNGGDIHPVPTPFAGTTRKATVACFTWSVPRHICSTPGDPSSRRLSLGDWWRLLYKRFVFCWVRFLLWLLLPTRVTMCIVIVVGCVTVVVIHVFYSHLYATLSAILGSLQLMSAWWDESFNAWLVFTLLSSLLVLLQPLLFMRLMFILYAIILALFFSIIEVLHLQVLRPNFAFLS